MYEHIVHVHVPFEQLDSKMKLVGGCLYVVEGNLLISAAPTHPLSYSRTSPCLLSPSPHEGIVACTHTCTWREGEEKEEEGDRKSVV